MKQVLQDLKTGEVIVAEVPEPAPAAGRLLVRVQASLLSAGTESAQVAKGRQSLVSRVREKPQLLRQGLEELRARGVAGVRARLASKLEGYAELGYSCAGIVVDNGETTSPVAPGTLVACAGTGIANHAEFVLARPLLTAAATNGVTPEAAAYTTVGAIAMQGIRQGGVQLGETVAVIGLGLVGLLTAQLLRAQGCTVVGIDPAPAARDRGLANGCDAAVTPEQALDAVLTLSGGIGADAVIICAATSESAPVELAGKLARARGRVVMVGATGMTIPRQEYYLKELSFVLSRSYGPGRYDPRYEEEGQDYPVEYVRFTEQRNMQAFLDLVAKGRVEPARLTTHRFKIEEATAAYTLLNDRGVDRVGIVLTYESPSKPTRLALQLSPPRSAGAGVLSLGFIGAGAYAQSMLLPLLKRRTDIVLRSVVTRNGSHGLQAARQFGFEKASTRVEEVLEDPAIQAIFISTRHDSHAPLACQALKAGKHVWVEKPLALTLEQLKEIWLVLRQNPSLRLVVGFNRPFSRSARWLAQKLGVAQSQGNSAGAMMMNYRVNAGQVPLDSWINDPAIGGGRLLGEGCHFFDFLRWMAGAEPESVHTEALAGQRGDLPPAANFSASIRFANGSVAQLLYSSQGASGLGKEYFECFAGETCGTINDFQSAEFFRCDQRQSLSKHVQDKGQAALLDGFIACVQQGQPPPVPPEQSIESSLLALAAQESLGTRQPVPLAALRKLLL